MAHSSVCYEYCDSPLPAPAGKSPFHIRGEFYRHLDKTIATVDTKSGGALSRSFAREGLDAFQRQPFVSSAFYDNLPLPRIVMCLAEATGRDVIQLTDKMGRASADTQLKGKYKDLVHEMTLANFQTTFRKLLGFFYDYGNLTVTRSADGARMQVRRDGLPLAVIEWWCAVSIPFVKVPLERNGAKGLEMQWSSVVTDAQATIPVGTAIWDITLPR